MSLAPQQFCVRWNSYHSNLQTVFPKLLTTENFVDVTLACENRQIKCHKVVLSACSTYFERLLIQNPCKHPIIFMKDMRFSEMQSLVDFMYKGEVNVSQDDLPSLLKSAEALQIRGLCGSESGSLPGASSPPAAPAPAPASPPSDRLHGSKESTPAPKAPSPVAASGASSPPRPARSPAPEPKRKHSRLNGDLPLKQETVEEDGLFYGEMENDELECGDQTEEDSLQTGIPGQPGSKRKASIRVRTQSELSASTDPEGNEALIKQLQQCSRISIKSFKKKNAPSLLATKELSAIPKSGLDSSHFISNQFVVESKADASIQSSTTNGDSGNKRLLECLITGGRELNDIGKNPPENKINEEAYDDDEYLQMWLSQNQELEVSMSTKNTLNTCDDKAMKYPIIPLNKKSSGKSISKATTITEEDKWSTPYYAGEFTLGPTRDESHSDLETLMKKSIMASMNVKMKKKVRSGGVACLEMVDFLEPSDLEQFLAGKEVSSSGISRKAIEQAMMGKYNPNRRYSNQAMWAALMDVKQGGSIYRAAQTHKVPRKSLRNWMKRWHIKSSFPMPQQLKQFVENNRKNKECDSLVKLGSAKDCSESRDTTSSIKMEDTEPVDFGHFLDMSHDFFAARNMNNASSEEDDIVDKKNVTETNSENGKNDKLTKKGSNTEYSQIMDMSGNILYDDHVASHNEDSQNEDEHPNTDKQNIASRAGGDMRKLVSFSSIEQLAGLDDGKRCEDLCDIVMKVPTNV